MDDVTRQVREMYERYPYPTRPKGVISDIHPGLLLSYLERPAPTKPRHILDAGCGTGMAALGTALCNPGDRVVAADLNRTALAQVRQEAAELKLANLEVCEVDLMTLDGLPRPEGGFDVIFCSGVLHHLADPARALASLAEVLSPQGVMRIMVYNRPGRHGLYRCVTGLDHLYPERQQLELRLRAARQIVDALPPDSPVRQAPWEDAAAIDDVEFVDRYLNLNDNSYTVQEFLELAEGAGLRFLRWHEPRHWDLGRLLAPELIPPRPERELWSALEQLVHRPQLDLLLVSPQARPRRPLPPGPATRVALSPQAALRVSSRVSGSAMLSYHPTVTVREQYERPLTGPERRLLEALGPQWLSLGELLAQAGLEPITGLQLAAALIEEEILYLPV